MRAVTFVYVIVFLLATVSAGFFNDLDKENEKLIVYQSGINLSHRHKVEIGDLETFFGPKGADSDDDDDDNDDDDDDDGDDDDDDDETLYDVIAKDDRFTILTKFLDEDDTLKEAFDKPGADLTVFAPVDESLKNVKTWPSKETIQKFILYHVVPKELSLREIVESRVLNSSLFVKGLNDAPQKLRVGGLFWKKVFINHAQIISTNSASNGIIHALNRPLHPPLSILTNIFMFPNHFSTLTSALQKVGLANITNSTKAITVFAPTNMAFARLGLRKLLHLFSPWGEKCLKRILLYHISPQLAYSSDFINKDDARKKLDRPKISDLDLDSLEGSKIHVRTVQFQRFLRIKVNGDADVMFTDILGGNGVAHVTDRVLIPKDLNLEELDELEEFGGFDEF